MTIFVVLLIIGIAILLGSALAEDETALQLRIHQTPKEKRMTPQGEPYDYATAMDRIEALLAENAELRAEVVELRAKWDSVPWADIEEAFDIGDMPVTDACRRAYAWFDANRPKEGA